MRIRIQFFYLNTVRIVDLDSDTVHDMIHYVYSGRVSLLELSS
jgi:hypothetical protein